jgi:hypothetical protein
MLARLAERRSIPQQPVVKPARDGLRLRRIHFGICLLPSGASLLRPGRFRTCRAFTMRDRYETPLLASFAVAMLVVAC